MNKKFLLSALLFLILCISAVNAEDINQTDCDLEISNSDVLSDTDVKSFSDLSADVNSSQGKLDIKSDYEFNKDTDKKYTTEGIFFNNTRNYIIEGNNHVIDAKNQSMIFKFRNTTVTINNLKIVNSNMSSIICIGSVLTTNNVTFENNFDKYGEGGSLYISRSVYYSNNDKFINNNAKYGSSINAMGSTLKINNATFKNDKPVYWSLIYGDTCNIDVAKSTFVNITSRYATVIYGTTGKLNVTKSKFINLFANATGGAIAAKESKSVNIEDCSFVNVTSSKNGGAVFLDINGGNERNGTVLVKDTKFENCSSEFGGALLQLGGTLNLLNSNFTSNSAVYSGGALYCANATLSIENNKFNKNNADKYYLGSCGGGALFIDECNSKIVSCDFIDNNASAAGAIYLNENKYAISNCYFNNNGYAIASYYDKKGSYQKNNQLNNDQISLNLVSFPPFFESDGKVIVLKPNTNGSASDSRFDLRDFNLSGEVKNQGQMGSCWAFGATGALETAFLKACNITIDLSENNIQNSGLHYGIYGTTDNFEGGYSKTGMGLFLSWLGSVPVKFDSYDELGKISLTAVVNDAYHIQDAIIIPKRQSALDNEKLKEALVKYGGLTVHLYGASGDNEYYNSTYHSQYYNGKQSGNHFVTLVGWDDKFPKENFTKHPEGDGAWICKNSWGSNWGENGYFYVSYYDTTFAKYTESVGYILNNTELYTKVYQYDVGPYDFYATNFKAYLNQYTATGDDIISAVGTYFKNAGENYKITVILGEENDVYTQSGKSTHGGFETIKLNKKIAVNTGQMFRIMIETKNIPLMTTNRIQLAVNQSFLVNDEGMVDIYYDGWVACIKAYTVTNPNPSKINSQYYSKSTTTTVYSSAEGKTISLVQEGKVLGKATVSNGTATFNLGLKPGLYSILTPYNGTYLIEGLEIKSTIESADDVKITYNTVLTLGTKFLDKNGNGLSKNNKIKITLDGKTSSTASPDDKGNLKITLSELSMGKHTLLLKNPVTLEEKTIPVYVVSRFSGNSNVNMYYADGSTFKVQVRDNFAEPVGANKIVKIKINKKTYKVKTNSNGYIKFKIPNTVKPGTYKLTATYMGQTIKNTVKVKQVLKLIKVKKVKKSAKKLVLKATLKKGKKAIKNKKLTFRFNGKKYTAKTNKKGIAKVTIKKSVLKKLKVGKKVKYQVTYLKNTVKRTVKVKK